MAIRIRDRRLARLGLLIAAALHLLGGGLLASVHAAPAAGGTAVVDARQDGGDPSELPHGHDADHCALCQAMGTAALPAAGSSLSHATVPRALAAEAHRAPAPAFEGYRPPARAPPASARARQR